MRIGVLLTSALLVAGCGGTAKTSPSSETSLAAASSTGTPARSECGIPDTFDAGPGSCSVAHAFVECTDSTDLHCLCLSDDPTTCPGCITNLHGAISCQSLCAANEYAVSCGGPPHPGANLMYQDVPSNCRGMGSTPGGNEYACCPCE